MNSWLLKQSSLGVWDLRWKLSMVMESSGDSAELSLESLAPARAKMDKDDDVCWSAKHTPLISISSTLVEPRRQDLFVQELDISLSSINKCILYCIMRQDCDDLVLSSSRGSVCCFWMRVDVMHTIKKQPFAGSLFQGLSTFQWRAPTQSVNRLDCIPKQDCDYLCPNQAARNPLNCWSYQELDRSLSSISK